MAEYIEREALIKHLTFAGAMCGWRLYLIKDEPAADVRPERHGVWIDTGKQNVWGDDVPVTLFQCSACMGHTMTRENQIGKYCYCPRCGAKMDGKEPENE